MAEDFINLADDSDEEEEVMFVGRRSPSDTVIQDTVRQLNLERYVQNVLQNEECVICQDKLGTHGTKEARGLKDCGHKFHKRCIQKWQAQSDNPATVTCPLCNVASADMFPIKVENLKFMHMAERAPEEGRARQEERPAQAQRAPEEDQRAEGRARQEERPAQAILSPNNESLRRLYEERKARQARARGTKRKVEDVIADIAELERTEARARREEPQAQAYVSPQTGFLRRLYEDRQARAARRRELLDAEGARAEIARQRGH